MKIQNEYAQWNAAQQHWESAQQKALALYQKAGFEDLTLDGMLEMSQRGIEPETAIMLVEEVGFAPGDKMSMYRIKELCDLRVGSCDTDIENIPLYARAGFKGDVEAICRLKIEVGQWTYVKILAEHGLAGKLDAMLEVSRMVKEFDFQDIARAVAFQLYASEVDSTYLTGGEAERLRAEHALEINPHYIAMLSQYDIEEEKLGEAYQILCDQGKDKFQECYPLRNRPLDRFERQGNQALLAGHKGLKGNGD